MRRRGAIARIVDANCNRATEGLRVCEDVVRFGLGWEPEVRRLRRLRHGVMAQVKRLPVTPLELIRARESRRDPGRRLRSAGARSLEHVLLLNLQRAKEALRALEESSRLLAPEEAGGFQRLRFQTYDVERRLLVRLAAVRDRRRGRLARS